MAIVTYEDVKAHLNLTDDRNAFELQRFIDAATNVVEQQIGPILPVSYTETQNVGGFSTLVLNHAPVQSVQSVTEYTWGVAQVLTSQPLGFTPTTTLGYMLDSNSGIMVRRSSGFQANFYGPVTVSYTVGRATVPAAVQLATLIIVAHLWQTQRGSSPLPSLGGDVAPPVGQVAGIPALALDLLKGFDTRLPTIA